MSGPSEDGNSHKRRVRERDSEREVLLTELLAKEEARAQAAEDKLDRLRVEASDLRVENAGLEASTGILSE